ncbi:MAG: hypothetical protein M5U19_19220 [Microthrixaceae bacterium]|nr:hypothetical protein [Microthrixaceae bacterium]
MPSRRDRRFSTTLVATAAVIVGLVVVGVTAKLIADSAAQSQVDERAAEVASVLEGASPKDFLAFNSGREVPESVAKEVADADDFVNVVARADSAVIRFQPKGWWAGFTERCVVAVVKDERTTVLTPKTACVRIDPEDY